MKNVWNYLPVFCECGGLISGKLGSSSVVCLRYDSEFKLERSET